MRISFDLDETLFINPNKNEIEKEHNKFLRCFYKEKLRKGTIELFNYLEINGHEIWIYTTSFRTVSYIKSYFRLYGLRLNGIINGKIHQDIVQVNKSEPQPSKYPSKFRIDLHIDDDYSVKANGDVFGFKVLILEENDKDWISKIKSQVH